MTPEESDWIQTAPSSVETYTFRYSAARSRLPLLWMDAMLSVVIPGRVALL